MDAAVAGGRRATYARGAVIVGLTLILAPAAFIIRGVMRGITPPTGLLAGGGVVAAFGVVLVVIGLISKP